jgi:hypothetical protein
MACNNLIMRLGCGLGREEVKKWLNRTPTTLLRMKDALYLLKCKARLILGLLRLCSDHKSKLT